MDRKQLLDSIEDLLALLTVFEKLSPGNVTEEFVSFLQSVSTNSVLSDVLLSAMKFVREQESRSKRGA